MAERRWRRAARALANDHRQKRARAERRVERTTSLTQFLASREWDQGRYLLAMSDLGFVLRNRKVAGGFYSVFLDATGVWYSETFVADRRFTRSAMRRPCRLLCALEIQYFELHSEIYKSGNGKSLVAHIRDTLGEIADEVLRSRVVTP